MSQDIEYKFTYYLGQSLYINITNLCTNDCVFCIRSTGECVGGVNLVLQKETHTAKDIIEELKLTYSDDKCSEIVFCGYGEPLIKLDMVKEVASFIKENFSGVSVRVNSNGHGNLVHKRNIVPELSGLIDKISISLNADNPKLYAELSKPKFQENEVFEAVKSFIKECVNAGIDTTATVVSGFGDYVIDLKSCEKLAKELGANFRVREWLPQGYD